MVEREPSIKEMATLWNMCAGFIQDNDIGCAEAIYQRDWIIENAQVLIEKICNEIGYVEYKEDE